MHVSTVSRPSHKEVFITATSIDGESPDITFGKVARVLRENGASVVSQEVFGLPNVDDEGMHTLAEAMGRPVNWPVTWIAEGREAGAALAGTQVWAIQGLPVEPVELEGRIGGTVFRDDYAHYCRLGGLAPVDPSRQRDEQTRDVFEQMAGALHAADMGFSEVLRTWFYNDEILAWYDGFNKVRDTFFHENGIFEGLVPASTGVGGRNASGVALVSGLLAVRANDAGVAVAAVPSPLQCPALEYGSSFSRAVEIAMPDHRRLLVSGTASITPDGRTSHVGDVKAQVALTMEVVGAILESRDMAWGDVVRGLAYFKHAGDVHTFDAYCRSQGFPALPVVLVNDDICRGDLLFEIELDAISMS